MKLSEIHQEPLVLSMLRKAMGEPGARRDRVYILPYSSSSSNTNYIDNFATVSSGGGGKFHTHLDVFYTGFHGSDSIEIPYGQLDNWTLRKVNGHLHFMPADLKIEDVHVVPDYGDEQ